MPSGVSWFGRRESPRDDRALVDDAAKRDAEVLKQRLERLEAQVAMTERYFTEAFWTTLDTAYEAILPERVLTCIVCGRKGRRDAFDLRVDQCLFGGGRLERYACPDCDCVFGPQKYLDLSDAFVGRDYQVLYSRYSESDSTERELRAFRSLGPSREGRYLDWGAGGGWNRTLETLHADGWDVVGHEPHALEPDPSQGVLTGGAFDGLFSNNVIEHFRDPITQFQQFHWLLKPGAKMAHASPCYEYSFAFTRFHTVFLLGRSPSVLAERTGFAIVDEERDGEYINYVFQRL